MKRRDSTGSPPLQSNGKRSKVPERALTDRRPDTLQSQNVAPTTAEADREKGRRLKEWWDGAPARAKETREWAEEQRRREAAKQVEAEGLELTRRAQMERQESEARQKRWAQEGRKGSGSNAHSGTGRAGLPEDEESDVPAIKSRSPEDRYWALARKNRDRS